MNLLTSVDKSTNIFVISHKSDQVSDKFDTVESFYQYMINLFYNFQIIFYSIKKNFLVLFELEFLL